MAQIQVQHNSPTQVTGLRPLLTPLSATLNDSSASPSPEPLFAHPTHGQAKLNLQPLNTGSAQTALNLDLLSPTLDDIRKGKILSEGAQGPAISQLQQLLTAAGYGVQITGTLGSTTIQCLKAFQASQGIQVTGTFGLTTLKALEAAKMGSTAFGRRLATVGRQEALKLGGYQSQGLCYTGVAKALAKVGVNVTGLSAYMAAPQLARSNKFKEVKIPVQQLSKLPAGAIIVWDRSANSANWSKGAGYAHGHISISDGNGREMSDYIDRQRTQYYVGKRFRVFLPR